MKSALVLLAALASSALASLNCTTTAELTYYCCPNKNSEVVKTVPADTLIMLGCAADDKTDGRWFWNYNNLFTPDTRNVRNCVLNRIPFQNTDVLPDCAVDDYVLYLTRDKHGPLTPCDPNCVSNNNLPTQTYFGDTVLP